MTNRYMDLDRTEREKLLHIAAEKLNRPPFLLEKDIWVVWAIQMVFSSPFSPSLVFKGGTSLSKAYKAIRRFSEDIDLTYDIRELVPDLVLDFPDAIPPTRSQEKRWTRLANEKLGRWVEEEAATLVDRELRKVEPNGTVVTENRSLFVHYDAVVEEYSYGEPIVKLEFGGRATGEPNLSLPISCDIADHVQDIEFPTATPRVLTAEMTFWEKATAAHVFCLQPRVRGSGKGFARHWHDLVRLDDVGVSDNALSDRRLAMDVAAHKKIFYREKDALGDWIDYRRAVSGELRIVPPGEALKVLANDYDEMATSGWFTEEVEPFGALMEACSGIEDWVNAR